MKTNKLALWLGRNWVVLAVGLGLVLLWPLFRSLYRSFAGVGSTVSGIFSDDGKKFDLPVPSGASRPSEYWAAIAEAIYDEIGWYNPFESDKAVVSYMKEVKSDADFVLLVNAFGEKREQLAGVYLGSPKGLMYYLKDELNDKSIVEINQDYASKGITYRI